MAANSTGCTPDVVWSCSPSPSPCVAVKEAVDEGRDLHTLRLFFTLHRCAHGLPVCWPCRSGCPRPLECVVLWSVWTSCLRRPGRACWPAAVIQQLGSPGALSGTALIHCLPAFACRYGVDNETVSEIRAVSFRQVVRDLQVCAIKPLRSPGEKQGGSSGRALGKVWGGLMG